MGAKLISLWEIESITFSKKSKLIKTLIQYENKYIEFDRTFNHTDSTKLYCSEFVNNVLKKVDSLKFNFPINNIKLNSFYSRIIKQDSLKYYPVDVFQYNKHIKFINEWDID